jgi:hypothetical protein
MGIGGARVRGVAFCTHSRTLALRAFINRAAFQMSGQVIQPATNSYSNHDLVDGRKLLFMGSVIENGKAFPRSSVACSVDRSY